MKHIRLFQYGLIYCFTVNCFTIFNILHLLNVIIYLVGINIVYNYKLREFTYYVHLGFKISYCICFSHNKVFKVYWSVRLPTGKLQSYCNLHNNELFQMNI